MVSNRDYISDARLATINVMRVSIFWIANPREPRLTSNTADTIHDSVDHLLPDGVMTTGIVVGSILLAAYQQFRMEKLAVGTGSNLINRRRVEIHEDGSGNMLSTAGLGEKRFERALVANVLRIRIGSAIWTEAMFEKIAKKSTIRNMFYTITKGQQKGGG